MTTVTQILTGSARALGYLGRTEVLKAGDANDALICFNGMLDSWAGENLASWANQTITFSMVTGTSAYTIGASGTVNATRPDNIVQAFITDQNNLDYPLNVIPQNIWNNIGDKNITSQIPTTLFYDPQYPLGILNIFPIPMLSYTCTLNAILQQATFSSFTQSLSTPPGYEAAYRLNLAVEMISFGFPCLLNEQGLGRLYENASVAKSNIKRKNLKEVIADYDPYIISNSYATYNIYSDGMPRR